MEHQNSANSPKTLQNRLRRVKIKTGQCKKIKLDCFKKIKLDCVKIKTGLCKN